MLLAAVLLAASASIAAPTNDLANSSQTNLLSADLQRLEKMSLDAEREVEGWIQAANSTTNPAPQALEELGRRIEARLGTVQNAYETLVASNPTNDLVRVDYASFLSDVRGDEPAALKQLETALTFTTNNADIYNNLANIYGHIGSVRTAFDYYTRAIEINPRQPIYYQNFGTTVFLFRTDVKEHYGINEQQVFDKALDLYAKAMRLDPTNFALATDVALTYYGISPPRTKAALQAWTNALQSAQSSGERQDVALHLARLKIKDREFQQARAILNTVTNQEHMDVKRRLERTLDRVLKENQSEDKEKPDLSKPASVHSKSQAVFNPIE